MTVDTNDLTACRERASYENIHFVRLLIADLNGVAIGKTLPADRFFAQAEHGFHFALSGLIQDIEGENTEVPGFTTATGDSDFTAFPLLDTFQTIPYRPGWARVLLSPTRSDGLLFPQSSEGVLQNVLQLVNRLGFQAQVATELEFYLFRPGFEPVETGLHAYRHVPLDRLGPVVDDLIRNTMHLGLTVEGWLHEYAPGQIEINFAPDDPLTMARRTFLFKQMVREVAALHGYEASFLAKPRVELSGSGTHVHCSLWKDGNNAFYVEGLPSSTLMQFVAGQIRHTADLFLLYAPNINSFRRLTLGDYMPTAATWGGDDRTVAFRLLTDSPNAARLEHRVAGADANPYLLLAGILAAGAAGIEGAYPPPAEDTRGISLALFPDDLPAAIHAFSTSAFVREWLGPDVVDALTIIKRQEWRKTMAQITDWERATYGILV